MLTIVKKYLPFCTGTSTEQYQPYSLFFRTKLNHIGDSLMWFGRCFLACTYDVVWKHISTLYSPTCLFLRAIPVGKLAGGTATTCADTASAASGNG